MLLTSLYSALFRSSRRHFLLGTVLAALMIRVALIVFVSDPKAILSDPKQTLLYEHGQIAHNLHTGHGFAMQWPYVSTDSARRVTMSGPPQFEGAFLPPLNPYLLAGLYAVFGETTTALYAMMLLMAIIGAVTVIPIYRAAHPLGGERSARVAVLVFIVFLPAAYGTITYSGSALYQCVAIVILALCVQVSLHASWRSVLWLSALCAGMTFLRSEFFFLGFVMIVASLLIAFVRTRRAVMLKMLAGLGLCAAIIAPWTYRNYQLFHQFVPVLSHPWYELWRGNNRLASGATRTQSGEIIWISSRTFPELVRRMDSIPYDQHFEAKVDHVFKDAVISFATEDPARFVRLSATKLLYFFTIDPTYPGTKNPLFFGPMFLVVVLSVVGLGLLWKRPGMWPAATVLSLFFAYYLFMTAMTVALPRYQIYVFCSMIALTGVPFRERDSRRANFEWRRHSVKRASEQRSQLVG